MAECTPSEPISALATTLSPFEKEAGAVFHLACADAPRVETNGAGLDAPGGVDQNAVQISSIDHEIGKAIPLDRRHAQVE